MSRTAFWGSSKSSSSLGPIVVCVQPELVQHLNDHGGKKREGYSTLRREGPGGAMTHNGFESLLSPSRFNVRLERN